MYCSAVTLEAYFGLFQERAKKVHRLSLWGVCFQVPFLYSQIQLSSTKHRNKAKLFFFKESRVAPWRWKYAFQTGLLQRPFHALCLCEKLPFERWGFCGCILSVGADTQYVYFPASIVNSSLHFFPKGGDICTYKCIWVFFKLILNYC